MKKIYISLIAMALMSGTALANGNLANAKSHHGGGGPTLVQQLEAKLQYQLNEIAEGNIKYYGPASKRTAKQLKAAIAAQAAGNPKPPILGENGVPVPVSTYSHTSYTEGTATPPAPAPVTATAPAEAAPAPEAPPAETPDNPESSAPESPDTPDAPAPSAPDAPSAPVTQ
jgi:hypothetical protein